MAVTTSIVSTAVSVGGAYYSKEQQRKAQNRAEANQIHANKIEKARASVDRAMSRRRAIAKARQAQAINTAQAQVQGIAEGSSPLQGSQGSLYSNLYSTFAQQTGRAKTAQQSFNLRQSANSILAEGQNRAALTRGLGSAVSSGISSFSFGASGASSGSPNPVGQTSNVNQVAPGPGFGAGTGL